MSIDAVLAPSGQGAVDVRGAERGSFLNAVISQEIEDLAVGQVAGALFLDPHGVPLALFDVAVLADRFVLLTPTQELADELARTLHSRTFLSDATFTLLDIEGWALRGERGREVAVAAGLDLHSGTVVEIEGALLIGRDSGVDLVGPSQAVQPFAQRLLAAGAEAGEPAALENWRIAHGLPAWAREVRAPHLPEEMGLLPTHVHLKKGCYPGQEAVARMWMLGRPRRRLARVLLAGGADAGWSIGTGKRGVEVTSATTYAGERVGLAYVPAEARPGDRYGDDEAAVVVRGLVAEGLAIPGHDPSVVRRRDRR
ncbi:MAG: folate-binding protein YgfZ [Nitriliruptorales bacterium]